MAFSWRYEDGNGEPAVVAGMPATEFPTQADAESWLGENWRALLDAGVDQVSLVEGDALIYGPMGLHPVD